VRACQVLGSASLVAVRVSSASRSALPIQLVIPWEISSLSWALLRYPFGMHMCSVRLAAKNNTSGFAPVLSCLPAPPFNLLRASLGVMARGARAGAPNEIATLKPSLGSIMNVRTPTYRIEIKNNDMAPNKSCGWQIYRNKDVLPILRSQQLFISRAASLADANRSRKQLVDADLQNGPSD
jgi:hypothetical protein